MSPFAKTGGLGDVINALPAELVARGNDLSIVLPFYRSIRETPSLKIRPTGVKLTVQVGAKRLDAQILECQAPNGVQTFLVRRDEYFDRSGMYGPEGRSYEDNAERFIFFSKAVVQLARRIAPAPDVIHVHDWPTALVPVFVKEIGLPFRTVLTMHNVAFQGSFWGIDFGLTNLPGDYFSPRGVEFHGRLNFLKGGIVHADAITTISPRYAQDIQTAEFGCGLEAVIREHASRLHGIMNGADYGTWNPATDPTLPKKYKPSSLAGKKACRQALLSELGLDPNPRGPVFSMVMPMSDSKAMEDILPILDRLLADDVRMIVVGSCEGSCKRDTLVAARRHCGRFAHLVQGSDASLRLLEAGSDITIVPERLEPGAHSLVHHLKYGTIPVARALSGLHQIIPDYDPATNSGTGFLFYSEGPEALWDAVGRAKELYRQPAEWKTLVQRAMQADFSWKASAAQFERLYQQLVSPIAAAA